MPANLTPQYRSAEEAFRRATGQAEKLAALEEMLATIPKHKGTEKMQADIKRRIAKMRDAAEAKRGKGGGVDLFHVEKHGAGQWALVGMPNAGKSALVAAVSHAKVNVAPYPFATHAPVPGMMGFEDVQVQLVDTPPVTEDGLVPGLAGTLRNADGLLLLFDLAAPNILEQVEVTRDVLRERGIVAEGEAAPEGGVAKPMLRVGTKLDAEGARDNLEALRELYEGPIEILATSAETGEGLDALARACFERLGVVRVYSKEPGKPADMEQPFILPLGSTVLDLAEAVHRDVAAHLKRARIWGSEKYDGQPVQRDHVLADGDVIELHV